MIWVDDLGNTEGPVLLPDKSWALVEMHPDRGWHGARGDGPNRPSQRIVR